MLCTVGTPCEYYVSWDCVVIMHGSHGRTSFAEIAGFHMHVGHPNNFLELCGCHGSYGDCMD